MTDQQQLSYEKDVELIAGQEQLGALTPESATLLTETELIDHAISMSNLSGYRQGRGEEVTIAGISLTSALERQALVARQELIARKQRVANDR